MSSDSSPQKQKTKKSGWGDLFSVRNELNSIRARSEASHLMDVSLFFPQPVPFPGLGRGFNCWKKVFKNEIDFGIKSNFDLPIKAEGLML